MSFPCASGHVAPDGSRPRSVATKIRLVEYPQEYGHKFSKRQGRILFRERLPVPIGTEFDTVEMFCAKDDPGEGFQPEVMNEKDDGGRYIRIQKPVRILDPSARAEAQAKEATWLAEEEKRESRQSRQRSSLPKDEILEEDDAMFLDDDLY